MLEVASLFETITEQTGLGTSTIVSAGERAAAHRRADGRPPLGKFDDFFRAVRGWWCAARGKTGRAIVGIDR
jgi:hypothetical protein